MADNETNEQWLERQKQKKAEAAAEAKENSNFEETVRLVTEPGVLYRLTLTRAFGGQDEKFGDWTGYTIDKECPIAKDFSADPRPNTLFLRKRQARTFRTRILRDVPNSDRFPELEVGWKKNAASGEEAEEEGDEPILIKVPNITEPVKVEFTIVEDAPKGGNKYGSRQIYGQVVPEFADKWESAEKFASRMKKEMKNYLATKQNQQDNGKKISAEDMGIGKIFDVVIDRAFAGKGDEPNFMIFKINREKSVLPEDLIAKETPEEKFNRIHLSGVSLKTFVKGLNLPPRDGSQAIQIGLTDKKRIETVQVPAIPSGGIRYKFARLEEESKTGTKYKYILGEVIQ